LSAKSKIQNLKSKIQIITRFFLSKVAARAQKKKTFFAVKQPFFLCSHLKNYLAEKVFVA
jgi:hypothetical protein